MRRTIFLVAVMAATLVLASGVALALTFANTPDPGTAGANGRVWDILRAGDRVYLAGRFTEVTNPDGTTFARNNLAAIDASTGRVTGWNPNVTKLSGTSSVQKMALSSDGRRLFVGGDFTRVGGLTRGRLAAVDPVTGAVDPNWRADANDTIFALSTSGTKLHFGGAFTAVAGQPRERLAAVDQATGALDPNWKPMASRDFDTQRPNVKAMDVSADGARVYVGGYFSHVNGVWTRKLAAVDAVTGNLVAGFAPADPNNVLDLDVSGGRVYVGAADLLEGVEAYDALTGKLIWSLSGGHTDPQSGDVQAIVAGPDGKVYVGGHFGLMEGLVRKRLLEVDAQTGQIGPWAPQVAGDSTNLGVWALEIDPAAGRLYAGGDFVQIGGKTYPRFARFSQQSVTPEAPPGTTSPTVLSTVPTDGATGVLRNASVVANFSEPMKASSVTSDTFKLYRCSTMELSSCITQLTDAPVSPSADGLSATLDPYGTNSTLLLSKSKYKAVLTTGAQDAAGNALDQDPRASGYQEKVWYFTTGKR